jgi:hypothetical protein
VELLEIWDEVPQWVRSIELVQAEGDDRVPGGKPITMRQFGKGVLTAEFALASSPGLVRMMREWEAVIAAQRERTVSRLANDLGRPKSLVRRQYLEVQRLLEAAGITDGYGLIAIPQPVRLPVPAPAR